MTVTHYRRPGRDAPQDPRINASPREPRRPPPCRSSCSPWTSKSSSIQEVARTPPVRRQTDCRAGPDLWTHREGPLHSWATPPQLRQVTSTTWRANAPGCHRGGSRGHPSCSRPASGPGCPSHRRHGCISECVRFQCLQGQRLPGFSEERPQPSPPRNPPGCLRHLTKAGGHLFWGWLSFQERSQRRAPRQHPPPPTGPKPPPSPDGIDLVAFPRASPSRPRGT